MLPHSFGLAAARSRAIDCHRSSASTILGPKCHPGHKCYCTAAPDGLQMPTASSLVLSLRPWERTAIASTAARWLLACSYLCCAATDKLRDAPVLLHSLTCTHHQASQSSAMQHCCNCWCQHLPHAPLVVHASSGMDVLSLRSALSLISLVVIANVLLLFIAAQSRGYRGCLTWVCHQPTPPRVARMVWPCLQQGVQATPC
jgi:hypothetical protein